MPRIAQVLEVSEDTIPEDYGVVLRSFERHLRAENKAVRTIETYMASARLLGTFLTDQRMPTTPDNITREHIEEFLIDLQQRSKPATVSVRFRALQQYFKWLAAEGEITTDPMARMKRPHVPEEPVAVPTESEVRALLKACEGATFEARRDMAIIRLFIDTGMRRSELSGLAVSDIDWDLNVAVVMGKGRRPRSCPFAAKTARALDRYLRARSKHPRADSDALWLGRAGPMTSNGIYQVVQDRAKMAGISLHPHQLRHLFAHSFRMDGGGEDDLMSLGGWRSRTMLSRYGRAMADTRAREAHKRFSPGEKF